MGRKVVVTLASSGRFLAASMNFFVLAARKSMSFPARSWRMKVTPPEVPTPMMAGGGKAKPMAPGMPAIFAGDLLLDRLVLLFRLLPLGPLLQGDEEEGAVGVLHLAQHAVADDRGAILDPRGLGDDLFGLPGHLAGSLQRGGVGQLDAGKDEPLVLVREKAGGEAACPRSRPEPSRPEAGGDWSCSSGWRRRRRET